MREAILADAEAIATVHVRSWQAAYRGQLPDEYLDGLTVEDRLSQHQWALEHPAKTGACGWPKRAGACWGSR